jgi:hypothetical protein
MITTMTETKPVIIETKKKAVSLILTHQARIRCLLDMIIKGKRSVKKESIIEKIKNNRKLNNSIIAVKNTINRTFNKYPVQYEYQKKEEEEEEIRFKNCSILRLCVNKETGLCLQLVYGGELDKGEGKGGRIYYIANELERTPESIVTEVVFENITTGLNRLNLTSNNFAKGIDEYVFYIGRHGQAEHNLKFATHLKTDTDVTKLGKEQAFRAGKILSMMLKKNKENINYVFASDLTRTRQTIENILNGMNTNQKQKYFPKEIIILPCSHELKYNSKGLCDKPPSFLSLKIGVKENDPKCSKTTNCVDNNIENPQSDCNHITLTMFDDKEIPLNWDFYFEKNENKMRNMDCSKTNMVKLAIEYINTSGISENKKRVVISNPVPLPNPPPKTPIISDDCLAECLKDFFNKEIDSNYDINKIKSEPLFIYLKSYFNDVYDMNDLNKKSYISFFEFTNKNNNKNELPKHINQDERDFFDNKLIKCLEEHCVNKKPFSSNKPPGPSPPKPSPPKPSSPPPSSTEDELNEEENNIRFWLGLYFNNKKTFYRDIKDLSSRDINVFDKVMDEFLSNPDQLNNMIQEYKTKKYRNKNDDIGFIIDYLGDRLKETDKNALKFMEYIKSENPDLYDEIERRKQIGGKKTRKNRKSKKRFLKRTKRSHKKNKSRRLFRKII